MSPLTVGRHVAASPSDVWPYLVEVRHWPAWGPTVTAVDPPVRRIGAGVRGTVRTIGGLGLPFEITRWVEGRAWAWTVTGLPATEHEIEPDGEGTRVTFGVPWWAPGYLVVCAAALRRLERLVLDRPN